MTPELTVLEHSLWQVETRFDLTFMDATFAPDFREFCRSGYPRPKARQLAMEVSGPAMRRPA